MNIPPLAIIQARLGSSRLPNKMLLPLCGKPLIERAWETTVAAFGESNVVVAMPKTEPNVALWAAVRSFALADNVFLYDGDENDVLGRFHACAHTYRWHPDSVIVRVTPDDWSKSARHMRENACDGIRHPVEIGAEAFTLAMLDHACATMPGLIGWDHGTPVLTSDARREHITHALFTVPARKPAPSDTPYSIDTQADYDAVRRVVEGH